MNQPADKSKTEYPYITELSADDLLEHVAIVIEGTFGRAHTYGSENADKYIAQDHAIKQAANRVRALKGAYRLSGLRTAVTSCSDAKEQDEGCFRAVRAENALRELVECKDLADEIDRTEGESLGFMERTRMKDEYRLRKPAAWKRAREALAGTTASAGASWIACGERMPEAPLGKDQMVWVCAERADGRRYVYPLWWVNRPLQEGASWEIEDENGDPMNCVGWHTLGCNSSYDEFFMPEEHPQQIVAWMPIEKPAPAIAMAPTATQILKEKP